MKFTCRRGDCIWAITTGEIRCMGCGRLAPWCLGRRRRFDWWAVMAVLGVLVAMGLAVGLLGGCGQLQVDPEMEVEVAHYDINMAAILTSLGHPAAKPEVHFYGAKAVTCGGICADGTDKAGLPWWGFADPLADGECVAGVTQGNLTIVMAPGEGLPLWTTALAHEMIHNDEVSGIDGHPVAWFGKSFNACTTGGTGTPLAAAIAAQQFVNVD